MEISEDTKKVIEFLNEFSQDTLRKKKDLGIILEVLASENNYTIANEIIFYGSALWSSYRIVKDQSIREQSQNIAKEIDNLFDKLENYLDEIAAKLPQEDKNRFENVYLARTDGSRLNIIDLCYDLHTFKKLQLESKKS